MTAYSLAVRFKADLRPSLSTLPADMPKLEPPPPPVAPVKDEGEICQLVTDWQARRFPGCGRALVEQKHDGIRAIWINGEIVTRNAAPIRCGGHAIPELRALERQFAEPMVFDAEYIEAGGFDATLLAFHRGARPEGQPPGLLMIFDAVPHKAWDGRAPARLCEARKEALRKAMAAAPGPSLRYVAHAVAMSAKDVETIAAEAVRRGHEGVVIKNPLAPYARGRGADWQRIKRKLTADCEIVDVEPVEHRDGTMAALIVNHAGRRVRITIGITPAERRELWTFWPRLIGRVIEVEAMETTAQGSLRQPRFSRWKDRI